MPRCQECRPNSRLVADNPDHTSVKTREAGHNVLSEMLGYFQELAIVDDQPDQIFDVIGSLATLRQKRVEFFDDA